MLDLTRLIQIDFPEQFLAIEVERSEVVLLIWVVVRREVIECCDGSNNAGDELRSHRVDAGSHVGIAEPTVDQVLAERVIQFGDGLGVVAIGRPLFLRVRDKSGGGGNP